MKTRIFQGYIQEYKNSQAQVYLRENDGSEFSAFCAENILKDLGFKEGDNFVFELHNDTSIIKPFKSCNLSKEEINKALSDFRVRLGPYSEEEGY